MGSEPVRIIYGTCSTPEHAGAHPFDGCIEWWSGPAGTSPAEIRVTDPTTGGEKGQKLQRFDLVPFDVLWELSEHFGRGAAKYEERNWERGYKWSLSFQALLRHLIAWWLREDNDAETGSSHLIAVIWHACALRWYQKHNKGTDDRPHA